MWWDLTLPVISTSLQLRLWWLPVMPLHRLRIINLEQVTDCSSNLQFFISKSLIKNIKKRTMVRIIDWKVSDVDHSKMLFGIRPELFTFSFAGEKCSYFYRRQLSYSHHIIYQFSFREVSKWIFDYRCSTTACKHLL